MKSAFLAFLGKQGYAFSKKKRGAILAFLGKVSGGAKRL
jgi:hypothetical protein